jgi:glycosyltransferase involved in cell wall biosynthesis
MKVLHVIPSVSERSGGPGHAIISMCRSLQEQGTEVVIATTDHGMVSSSEFQVPSSAFQLSSPTSTDTRDGASSPTHNQSLTRNSKLETRNYYKGVPTLFFPLQWGESFKYSKPLAAWLDANVKTFDVVHIHAVFNHACLAAARACRKHNVPYVVRPLGTLDPWSMKQKPLRKFLFWQLAGKHMLKGAAAVHYTASAEQSAAEESLGLNHGRVIPLGIDAQLPVSVNGKEILSRKLAKLGAHPYVLVLSRLHPKKGLDIFIDAFVSLVQKPNYREWRLVIAGEGPVDYVQELKQKVAAHQVEDSVLFPGWLGGETKDAFLQHASLLALPSYHENFGLCVMEALAARVPVLVSPHVNLAEEIEAAGAGWISEIKTEDLEAALVEALRSESERDKRGKAGENLSRDFSSDRVASQLNALYSSVLE